MDKLLDGGVLYVRWLDGISRRYDELNLVMQLLIRMGVKIFCTFNGMQFERTATNAIDKATRYAVLAFIAAEGETGYFNQREMQKRGIDVAGAAANGRYKDRARALDPATSRHRVRSMLRASPPLPLSSTSTATVKRYCPA